MCGIVGLVRKGGITKNDVYKFTKMLARCEKRGNHATGVFNSDLDYVKAPVPSRRFIKIKKIKRFMKESVGCDYIIGHCRFATRGDPSNNENNHPVFDADHGIFLIHNGMVSSKKYDKTPSLTDTTIFIHAIHDNFSASESLKDIVEKIFNEINMSEEPFDGNSSVIVVANDKEVVFAKSTDDRPLVFQKDNGRLIFASEKDILGLEITNRGKENDEVTFERKIFGNFGKYSIAWVDLAEGTFKSKILSSYPKPSPITWLHVDAPKPFPASHLIDSNRKDLAGKVTSGTTCIDCKFCRGDYDKEDIDDEEVYCEKFDGNVVMATSSDCPQFIPLKFEMPNIPDFEEK